MKEKPTREKMRLEAQRLGKEDWQLWGPYLSERAWGTVREDYSGDGEAWDYFAHGQARSRAYRWSEDGIGGICDAGQLLCLAITLWNGRDPFLKEGLAEHGFDVVTGGGPALCWPPTPATRARSGPKPCLNIGHSGSKAYN
jgi:hypothetical protein